MEFFKSVFSEEDPDPSPSPSPDPQKDHNSPSQSPKSQDPQSPNPEPESSSSPGAWNFGGLIKTLASKSETVIQVYRRDLEEFRTGFKKETEIIREAATHALKELPASIEVAQQSIGSVGHVIDEFGNSVWRGTSEILSSKESILDLEPDSSDNQFLGNSKRYSRFEAQVSAIQSDVTTFCEEPEDLSDFGKWKLGFVLEEKREEIESLVGENGVMEEIYRKLVPGVVDRETFWERYFYRVYKLKQVDDARADLVKRAISGDEEELSWEVDDDDDDDDGDNEEEKNGSEAKSNSSGSNEEKKEIVESVLEKKSVDGPEVRGSEVLDGEADVKAPVGQPVSDNVTNENVKPVSDNGYDENVKPVSDNVSNENVQSGEKVSSSESKSEEVVNNSDEKSLPEEKNNTNESSKGIDLPVVAIKPSVPEEEDIGWDEIEDVDKKMSVAGSPNSSAVPKQPIAADEEEDLSWDIEDDDEPVKH